jgi:hypothetical protein
VIFAAGTVRRPNRIFNLLKLLDFLDWHGFCFVIGGAAGLGRSAVPAMERRVSERQKWCPLLLETL